MSQVHLCNIPELSTDYNHSFDFRNVNSQLTYFFNRVVMTVEAKIHIDAERETLVVNKTMTELKNCNYVLIQDNTGKYMFYFVTNVRYKTESYTHMDIEIDVLQTYQFDAEILESFVDRCHVDRWGENGEFIVNNIEESLDLGEYIITEEDKLYKLTDNFVLTATNPLGEFGENTPPITEDELTDYNSDWGSKDNRPEAIWKTPTSGGVSELPPGDNTTPGGGTVDTGITPDNNPTFGNYTGYSSTTITDGDIINLSLTNNVEHISSTRHDGLYFNNGDILYSFGNFYTPVMTDINLKDFKRGTILKTNKDEDIYIDYFKEVQNSNVFMDIEAKGTGFTSSGFATLYGIPDTVDWGNWILVKMQMNYDTQYNRPTSIRYWFFGFLSSDYNVGDRLSSINDTNSNQLSVLKIGKVMDKYPIGDGFMCYMQSINFSRGSNVTIWTKRLQCITGQRKNINLVKNGFYRLGEKQNIENYPIVKIDDNVSIALNKTYLPFPTLNAARHIIRDGTQLYQVYSTYDEYINNKAPLVIAPVSGVVVYAGTATRKFIALSANTQGLVNAKPHNMNVVVLQIAANVYVEFSNLGNINVKTGDVLTAGAIVGTCNNATVHDLSTVSNHRNGFNFNLMFIVLTNGIYTRHGYLDETTGTINNQAWFNGKLHVGNRTDLMTGITLVDEFSTLNPEAGYLSAGTTGNFLPIDHHPLQK